MPVNGPRLDDINVKVNTVLGLKKYQEVKKNMSEFNTKLQEELNKKPNKIDRKIQ